MGKRLIHLGFDFLLWGTTVVMRRVTEVEEKEGHLVREESIVFSISLHDWLFQRRKKSLRQAQCAGKCLSDTEFHKVYKQQFCRCYHEICLQDLSGLENGIRPKEKKNLLTSFMSSIWMTASISTSHSSDAETMAGVLTSLLNSRHCFKIVIFLFALSQNRLAVSFSVK